MKQYQKFFNLLGHSKTFIFFIFCLFLFSSILEILGIGLIGWFIGDLADGNGINFHEKSYLNIIENIWPSTLNEISIAYIIGGIIILRFFFQIFINYLILYLSSDIERKIKSKVVVCSLNVDYENFTKKSSSEIYNEVTNLTGQFGVAYYSLIKLFNDLILLTFITILLLNINFKLFFVLILFSCILFLSNKFFLWEKIKILGKKFNIQSELSFKNIKNGLDGFKQIKVMNQTSFFVNEILKSFQKVMSLGIRYNFYNIFIRYFVELFLALILIAISIIVNKLYSSQEAIALLAIFSLSAIRSLPLINNIINSSNNLFYLNDSTNKLYEATKNYDKIILNNNDQALHDLKEFKNLKLYNLNFSYKNKNIFKNLNFEIKKNDFILITGPSGSGKTTLIDLILGLLKPDQAQLTLNDKIIDSSSYSLNNLVYYLPQKNFMINDTIEKNIILTTKNFDKKKLDEAIELSGLKNFFTMLESKDPRKIGENGALISGGESQRIAFARSIYADREVLILDEFTSALDDTNEKLILDSLVKLNKNKTIIVVSHNMEISKIAKKSFKIENRKIINFS
jgi:ATP-binding cassette, subfamily B, bacterial PglK